MPKYRKKPVVIDAVQWTGKEQDLPAVFDLIPVKDDGRFELTEIDSPYVGGSGIGFVPALGTLDIPTLEGTMTAQVGDWIIKGVKGEVYPCKPDIFEATYERVQDEDLLEDDRRGPFYLEESND